MAKLEITNMVMVQNRDTGEVVVQNRIKNLSINKLAIISETTLFLYNLAARK